MINVENLSKSYGSRVLFDNLGFKLNSQGTGRTGRSQRPRQNHPLPYDRRGRATDAGSIVFPGITASATYSSSSEFTGKTVLEEAMKGLPEQERPVLEGGKNSGRPGIRPGGHAASPETFSGGYQVRLNLAKVLIAEPDLLLLDEPTNYLDITSIRWVERFLNSWPRELMLITHDRSFMDKVVTHTIGIHRRKVRKIAGNTEKYYTQIAQEEEIYEKTRLNDERRRKEIELFIGRFRAKARSGGPGAVPPQDPEKLENRQKLEASKHLIFLSKATISGKTGLDGSGPELFIRRRNAPHRRLQRYHSRRRAGLHYRQKREGKNDPAETAFRPAEAEGRPDYIRSQRCHGAFSNRPTSGICSTRRTVEEEILDAQSDSDRQTGQKHLWGHAVPGRSSLEKNQRIIRG